jgi:hypothetical protein
MDWLVKQVEDVSLLAMRELVTGLSAAGQAVNQILNWAKAAGDAVMRQVIGLLDAAGSAVSTMIDWAKQAGAAALSLVGEVLIRARHTVDDVLLWVEKDAIPTVAAVVKGMISAGATLADLMAWAATRTVEAMQAVAGELLAAGNTMAALVADTLTHPGDALANRVKAFDALGKTLKDVVNSAIVQPTEDAARQVFAVLKALGKIALDVLKAAAELGGTALALALTMVLEWFPGSYRALTGSEQGEAQKVFGGAIPLAEVRVAAMSPPVDLIEWVNGQRPFTTMFLINFASWADVKIETLMHEMTHVWQGIQTGPLYMVQAIEAQMSSQGYNYGYTDAATGEGAQDALNAAAGDFSKFNREQQAQIIMHYYVRKFEKSLDFTAWQPYANLVHA